MDQLYLRGRVSERLRGNPERRYVRNQQFFHEIEVRHKTRHQFLAQPTLARPRKKQHAGWERSGGLLLAEVFAEAALEYGPEAFIAIAPPLFFKD